MTGAPRHVSTASISAHQRLVSILLHGLDAPFRGCSIKDYREMHPPAGGRPREPTLAMRPTIFYSVCSCPYGFQGNFCCSDNDHKGCNKLRPGLRSDNTKVEFMCRRLDGTLKP